MRLCFSTCFKQSFHSKTPSDYLSFFFAGLVIISFPFPCVLGRQVPCSVGWKGRTYDEFLLACVCGSGRQPFNPIEALKLLCKWVSHFFFRCTSNQM
ncbi:hypothetical protein TB1_023065 [Malus domestica]